MVLFGYRKRGVQGRVGVEYEHRQTFEGIATPVVGGLVARLIETLVRIPLNGAVVCTKGVKTRET